VVWSWNYQEDEKSVTTSGFPNQGEAEAWLGESWQELYDAGTRSVTLADGYREVYTMSLEAG